MIAYDPLRPLISIHIPKTGGTSFRQCLDAWFGRRLYLHYADEKTGAFPPRVRLRRRIGRGLRANLCIHGHFNMNAGLGIAEYYPEASQFIAWVRDPVEAQVSLFSHQLKNDGGALYKVGDVMHRTSDIDEFFEMSRCPFLNYFPRRASDVDVQQQIETLFVHVGVLECAEKSLEHVAQKLGRRIPPLPRKNATPRVHAPSESSIRKFREKSRREYELFERACRLNG